jgi:hypothetical protein
VRHQVTCRPIERLLVKKKGGFSQVGVYGYSSQRKQLVKPISGCTELPEPLVEIFGLVLETREGFERGEEDAELILKVMQLLQLTS